MKRQVKLKVTVEKARVGDAPQIHRLVNYFADRGEMLHRPLSEIYEHIRDYFVIRDGDDLVGCAALHVSWEDLAEIRALAVKEECGGQGYGTQLVKRCLEEARQLEISRVYTLTYRPGFFERLAEGQTTGNPTEEIMLVAISLSGKRMPMVLPSFDFSTTVKGPGQNFSVSL